MKPLQRTILAQLAFAPAPGLPRRALVAAVCAALPDVKEHDVRRQISELAITEHIAGVADGAIRDVRFTITSKGKQIIRNQGR